MLTRMLVLWLLAESPLHGYRIRQILRDDVFGFWFPVEDASIYSCLRTLEKRGWARVAAVEQEGKRPRRTRYAITRSGRAQLRALVKRAWLELPPPGDRFHLALAARAELTPQQELKFRSGRVRALRARLAQLRERAAPSGVMATLERARIEAEIRVLKGEES